MPDTTHLTVSRTISSTPRALFGALSDPPRHAELDGSGMVRGVVGASCLGEVGDVFTTDVHHETAGDYRTDNHVTAFEQDAQLAWRTAAVGADPSGWEWRWTLEPRGGAETHVTLTYDWSAVTDPDVLARVPFPVVSQQQLEESLDHLEAAVR